MAAQCHLPELVVHLLANRGISPGHMDGFLKCDETLMSDPYLLKDMDRAIDRLKRAVNNKERILIFGDYDVDGVTSVAMLSRFLTGTGTQHMRMLPQRHVHGYDFSEYAYNEVISKDVDLVICLDCGSNSAALKKVPGRNIDVIVIDHHEVDAVIDDFILVNPKRPDSVSPFRGLSTGALIFKFLSAYLERPAYEYVDLAALSIVCDVAPLIAENRFIVRKGLDKIRSGTYPGLQALMDCVKVRNAYIDTFHIGWKIGPRLNAAGRICRADLSLDLLMCDDYKKGMAIAAEIERINKQRKMLSDDMRDKAIDQVESNGRQNDFVQVLSGEGWNQGVVGIVASNIKERYYRPAIVFSLEEGVGRGSGRSIYGFNILAALEHCSDLLVNFGGHERACGVEIKEDDLELFRERINNYARDHLADDDFQPVIYVDAQISFSALTESLVGYLSSFAPFGEANPEPVFATYNVRYVGVTDASYGWKMLWFEHSGAGGSCRLAAKVYKTDKRISQISKGTSYNIAYTVNYDPRNHHAPVSIKLKDIV